MRIFFLLLVFVLTKFTFAIDHDWERRFQNNIKFKENIKARLELLSTAKLGFIVERVKAFELKKRQVKERLTRIIEEERKRLELEEIKRQRKIQAYMKMRFGGTSVLSDFFPNRI